jgi:hypothetical protein
MMTSNEFGRYVEDLFEAECLFRGISVSKCHPRLPFDFTANVGGFQFTIQVKGVRHLRYNRANDSRHFRVRCHRKDSHKTSFHDAGISLMAIFIEPLKRWHIFTPPKIRGKIEISRNPTGRMSSTINRWDLLGAQL